MWAYESVFYQIYPLGFVGAPFENDGVETHRILKVLDWTCLLYTSPSPRDGLLSRMPSSA